MTRPHVLIAAALCAALVGACVSATAQVHAASPANSPARTAIVTRDQTLLRAAPNISAPAQTTLWRGDLLEVRGERGEYLQVWDHHRERGGWVARALVHRAGGDAGAAQELLAVLGFVSEQRESESLGIALAAAVIEAMPAEQLAGIAGAAVLDAIGRQAERLAERANAARTQDAPALSAHLDSAARHGVRFASRSSADGRVQLCYDGEAWRRLLALKSASAEQRARAAVALSSGACDDANVHPRQREVDERRRAEVLERIAADEEVTLSPLWRNRLAMRRAVVLANLAFLGARKGDAAAAHRSATSALAEFTRVQRGELFDDDLQRHTEAALQVNAVRWAADAGPAAAGATTLAIATSIAADGQTCVALFDTRWEDGQPLAQRCTWGLVWSASASVSREGHTLALAVQPTAGWRELWLFRRKGKAWTVNVLPPAAAAPGIGYAEFAGWVPGGQQVLVAREAVAEGRTLRRFEVLRLDSLAVERQHSEPAQLGAFNRWGDAAWRRGTVALR